MLTAKNSVSLVLDEETCKKAKDRCVCKYVKIRHTYCPTCETIISVGEEIHTGTMFTCGNCEREFIILDVEYQAVLKYEDITNTNLPQ